ncbi:FAD-dependent monooxygenase [Actinoplanes sp. TFC3]|uniref:FAD-dependent monooxygenase n=1 Tax=Actinoplanes sp. TFC3 TaxID=1710355 RepID=UPI00082AA516|nr:FAD-dependent monooxygenase [Actinoplanes sp. TFC3]
MPEVIVVGAGPAGLLLATELQLAGVDTVLIERDAQRPDFCRGFNLNARALDLLARRGLAARFIAEGWQAPHAAFSGLPVTLGLAGARTDHPYSLGIPQTRVEELLEQHAIDLGVDVRRGHELRSLTQDAGQVTATITTAQGDQVITARYLVGCDGGRSTVRKKAGIAFPGTASTTFAMLGDVEFAEPAALPFGVSTGAGGSVMVIPRPGYARVVTNDPDPSAPLTLQTLQATMDHALGRRVEIHSPRWLTRFGNATRQADRYVHGRILLAGDAAHIHPPAGAIGVNIALDDAFNLGWKLAATVHGTAPASLLDTYHSERHAAGKRLLASTRAQMLLGEDPDGPMAEFLTRLASHPAGNKAFAEVVTNLDTRYEMQPPGEHPWLGCLVPDLELATDDGATTLSALLAEGRWVLLDLSGELGRGLRARCAGHPEVGGVLVRPDGHAAWVSTVGRPDIEGLEQALDHWGEPW